MTRHRIAATFAVLALAAAGCGAKSPDYTSLLTTTTSAKPTATETPVPISQYLESAGVVGQPVAPDKLTDITVTMPRPKGWEQYSNPRFAPGTRVIAKGDTYPTAMLLVFQLSGGDRTVGELPAAQRVSRRLQGIPFVDDRGQL